MMIQNISIKMLVVSIQVLLGIMVLVMTFISANKYYDEGIQSQSQSVSRLMEIFFGRELAELERKNSELGSYIQTDSEFRKQVKLVIADSGNTEARAVLLELLNAQFNQKFVTTGVLKLNKIKVYNKKLSYVMGSRSNTVIDNKLPEALASLAKGRKGAERMKRVSALWAANDSQPYYSSLMPIGGLRLLGYIEVITDPVYQYKRSARLVGIPTAIQTMNNKTIFTSQDWEKATGKNILPIQYIAKSLTDKAVLVMEGREDFTEYNEKFRTIEYAVLSIFIILIGGGTVVSLIIMRQNIFLPMKQMITVLKKIGDGDLTVQTKTHAMRELSEICSILNIIINKLRGQVDEVSNHSEGLLVKEQGLNVIASTLKNTLDDQDQDIQSVASAIDEMTYSIQEVAKNAATTSERARTANTDAKEGADKAKQSLEYMARMLAEMQQAGEVISQLGTESDGITAILDTIKGIAEQTNLLALNAAIEAARAGEQGRGFAVVADEVRSLAQKTQESTQDIENKIQGLQEASKSAIDVMTIAIERSDSSKKQVEEIAALLSEISSMITSVNDQTAQIATAVEEQTSVSELIGGNVASISEKSASAAEMAKQIDHEASEVKMISNNLKQTISHFTTR